MTRPRTSCRSSWRSTIGAPDGPGALSHFDLARKDCVGTARNTTSKVWYTVANGVLSDVYYPTVDNTNVETLQYIVTDGSTFTDLQTRDMTSSARALDAGGMVCQVTSTRQERPLHDRHRLLHRSRPEHAADEHADRAAAQRRATYQVYVRFDPTVNGNGGGGVGQRRPGLRRHRHVDGAPDRGRLRHRSRPPTPPTGTTRSRCSPRSTARSRRSPTASPAPAATA